MPTKKKTGAGSPRPRRADEMRAEYDFREGARGKHAARYPKGSLVVTLDPDVALAYPSAAAVNAALRSLMGPFTRRTRQKRSA
jgi:hypothetical protein